jgi:hypothetical protein
MDIYCFCHPTGEVYHDDLVYLGEGLESLGHRLYGNRNLWRKEPGRNEWLIKHDPAVGPADCALVLVAGLFFECPVEEEGRLSFAQLPEEVLRSDRRNKVVMLDTNDGWLTPAWRPQCRKMDLVLRTKLNKMCSYPDNFRPWVLGYSSRVERMAREALPFDQRQRVVLDNFGYSHAWPHTVRQWARHTVYPGLRSHIPVEERLAPTCTPADGEWNWMMHRQTARRHNPAYFRDLGNVQVVSAFCGDWLPQWPRDCTALCGGGRKAELRRNFWWAVHHLLRGKRRAIQWDSWRFWEALVCGTVPLTTNLGEVGVTLPVMPEPNVHYMACDRDGRIPPEVFQAERLRSIAENGTAWATENYSPQAAARRLLAWSDLT